MGLYRLTEGNDNLGFDPFRYPSDDPGPYVVYCLGGDDNIAGGALNDTIYGGEGNDSLSGAAGANLVRGGNGNDYIQIYNEGATGPNYDLLADYVLGEAGDDSIQFILGGASVAHKADGGAGIDTLAISFESRYDSQNQLIRYSKVIDLHALWTGGWGRIDTGYVRNMEILTSIQGGQGSDKIIVGNYHAPFYPGTTRPIDLLIDGNAGDDYISGGASYDQINGGAGNDKIYGNDGDDSLAGGAFFNDFGNDTMYGGDGNDVILGDRGNDRLFGDAGDDNIQDQAGNNLISGGTGNDRLSAQAGNDRMYGGEGNDNIQSGDGKNFLYGEAGDDSLFGGSDADLAKGGDGQDFINMAGGNDQLYGGAGNDTMGGSGGSDQLYGEDGDDTLQGGNGADRLYGGQGGDTLDETVQDDASADQLYGEAGADILRGGNGNDRLFGGTGADSLTGGGGRDTFIFDSAPDGDVITDFHRSEGDRIHLLKAVFSGLAVTGPLPGEAFYAAAGADAAHDASDRIVYNTTTGALWYDADGAGGAAAQLIATLGETDHPAMGARDFLIIA